MKGNDSVAHLRNETIYHGISSQFKLLWGKKPVIVGIICNSQGECQHDGGRSVSIKLSFFK